MNKKIIQYRNEQLKNDTTGHSIDHINRVIKLTKKILETEPVADIEMTILAANLHDIIDEKLVEDVQVARQNLKEFLIEQNFSNEQISQLFYIIDNISYAKSLDEPVVLPLEGQIVQDADRLDAIGAIGIARAFYYGGSKGNKLYDFTQNPRKDMTHAQYREESNVINHFYEKLFLLKDLMNTTEGKRLAQKRTEYMKNFIEELKSEI